MTISPTLSLLCPPIAPPPSPLSPISTATAAVLYSHEGRDSFASEKSKG
ncbi:hypothetical protein TIFTF001_035407 [Ficus carica]|uniref:Uncharacterized protein n=1 Tax=Ficus carica TaxID=3494 RepID=A0AA88E4Q1_FICCA|nr:hypothetical protein TIFTF001_035380 [Ficus carica]GMN66324.1 hypothetical protein TIFTF001_035391 [Ficus carica]GMN66325.1 hypothetical protein TIFTF001_035396 [Ficus carica]GMN66340.1 hypothetical protein TIFTF001_035407 [Ficus carica]